MRVDDFHYELPPELIAQRPAQERELARLMVLPPGEGPPDHSRISDLPEVIPPASLVVINDTRVVPARLVGRRREPGRHVPDSAEAWSKPGRHIPDSVGAWSKPGARVQVLLVRRTGEVQVRLQTGEVRSADAWRALGKGLKFGMDIEIPRRGAEGGPPCLLVRLLGRAEDDGLWEVALWSPSRELVDDALHACGRVPLPPYIKRDPEPLDSHRYQTVYARHDGAVAAPTAGLHLTDALLGRLAARDCEIASITLHVGLGTFQPVKTDDFDSHRMQAERFVVLPSTAEAIARARDRGRPVVAVGTTTVRALETASDPHHPGYVKATSGETKLLVVPGHPWRIVDGLLTNFHLPRSTLLALVCAFGGTQRILDAYRLAVSERYRFFSYGDAMFLWRRG